ncbi:MAG: biotin/lipoyl-binding protein [Candidatus Cloacimonadota bacterium]|nr:MAG: biotin/lipoyl-binding protein [Candidatus Cloacimonadota bacterium]
MAGDPENNMDFTVYYKEKEMKVSVDRTNEKYMVTTDDGKGTFEAESIDKHTLSLIHNNKSILSRIITDGSRTIVIIAGEQFIFEEEKEDDLQFSTGEKSGALENILKSPMPGSVVKLFVTEGDEVAEGDILIIIEAMKMENELRAPGTMRVKKIYVKEGDQVQGFAPLLELE